MTDYNDNNQKAEAHRESDENGTTEKDLKNKILPGDMKPSREGEPMGGQSFGEENNTPSGDDENNPSQNAGYTNPYFRRTEPSEEHPENNNFKDPQQQGQPNYVSKTKENK